MDPIQGMLSGIIGTIFAIGIAKLFLGNSFIRITGAAIMIVGFLIWMFTKSAQPAGSICFLGFIAFSLGGGKL